MFNSEDCMSYVQIEEKEITGGKEKQQPDLQTECYGVNNESDKTRRNKDKVEGCERG